MPMDISKYPDMDMDKVERGDSGQINIYCIVHRENSRAYVGQTRDLKLASFFLIYSCLLGWYLSNLSFPPIACYSRFILLSQCQSQLFTLYIVLVNMLRPDSPRLTNWQWPSQMHMPCWPSWLPICKCQPSWIRDWGYSFTGTDEHISLYWMICVLLQPPHRGYVYWTNSPCTGSISRNDRSLITV